MRKTKLALCLILTILQIVFVLSACSNTADGEKITTPDVTQNISTETEAEQTSSKYDFDYPEIPEGTDYDGEDFNILTYPAYPDYIIIEEATSEMDSVDIAAYNRYANVEDKVYVNFTFTVGESYDKAASKFSQEVLAGETAYDLYVGQSVYLQISFATSGVCYNWLDLSDVCDFSQPYWNQSIFENLSVNDVLFVASGDYLVRNPIGILFNKELLDDKSAAYPYQWVDDGTWTFTKLLDETKSLSNDIDGGGVFDINDVYGFNFEYRDYLVSMMYGAGIKVVEKTEEGVPMLIDNLEKMDKVINYVHSLIYDNNRCYPCFNGEADAQNIFMDGRTAYYLTCIVKFYRSCDFEYGIVPCPKYDETQEKYYSNSFDNTMNIPITVKDPERVGIVVELLNAESRKDFLPEYMDTLMSEKVARDDESKRMLTMIYDNLTYDFGYTYSNWNNILYAVPWMMKADTTDTASWFSSNEALAQTWIDDVYAAMTTYGG